MRSRLGVSDILAAIGSLTRDSPTPAYRQIVDRVQLLIVAGGLAPGQQLPSQSAMAAHFGLDRNTIRRAVQELQGLGLIATSQGATTHVAGPPAAVPAEPAYRYRARLVRVVDGDTLRVDIDLGFDTWLHNRSVRLLGCNARELSEPGGREARENLATLLPVGSPVVIHTVKDDKYGGRYDAQVLLPDGTNLVERLVRDGWASPWTGDGVRPAPPWPRFAATV